MWIEILNTSYNANFNIKNKTPLGFLVAEPENLKSKYGLKKKNKKSERHTAKLGADMEIVLGKKEDTKRAAS